MNDGIDKETPVKRPFTLLLLAVMLVVPMRLALAEETGAKKADAPAPAADAKAAPAAEKKSDVPAIKVESEDDKFSYVVGTEVGQTLKGNGIFVTKDQFLVGFNDISQGKPAAMTDKEMEGILGKLQEKQTGVKTPEDSIAAIKGDAAFVKQLSYVMGADIATSLKRSSTVVNSDIFARAIEDIINGQTLAMTEEQIDGVKQAFMKKQQEKRKAMADKNLTDGKAFLAENAKKPGIKTTASGLQYLVVTEGKGEAPKATDTVKAHYRGTLIDGKEFDSSYARNEPLEIPVKGVIPGWTEALQLMHVGDKWKLFIPAELAYGERGAGPDIGPNSTLVFDIELLEIMKAQEKAKEEASSGGTISLDAGKPDAAEKPKK